MRTLGVIVFFLCVFMAELSAAPALLEVQNAWIRTSAPGSKVTAAYMKLVNQSHVDLTLKEVKCSIAGAVEIHETSKDKSGHKRMQQLQEVRINSGNNLMMRPGGLHIMLFDLKRPLAKGERVPLELRLANGTHLEVKAEVRDAFDPAPTEPHVH